jgi:hypothetical protein
MNDNIDNEDIDRGCEEATKRMNIIKAKKQPYSLTPLEETKAYLDAGMPADMSEWSEEDWGRADEVLEAAKRAKIERMTPKKPQASDGEDLQNHYLVYGWPIE